MTLDFNFMDIYVPLKESSILVISMVSRWNTWLTVPITLHKCISLHYDYWKSDLQDLVQRFHGQGYVHDDLRDANIISGNDGCVKLVDFD